MGRDGKPVSKNKNKQTTTSTTTNRASVMAILGCQSDYILELIKNPKMEGTSVRGFCLIESGKTHL